jgi:hypothetical protein
MTDVASRLDGGGVQLRTVKLLSEKKRRKKKALK